MQGLLTAVVASACCRAQVNGFTGSEARGILADEGLNLCPALAGGFLTTGPAGKSLLDFFFKLFVLGYS